MPVIARTAALAAEKLAAETLPKLLLDSVRSAAASMPTATLLLDRARSAAASVPKLLLDRVPVSALTATLAAEKLAGGRDVAEARPPPVVHAAVRGPAQSHGSAGPTQGWPRSRRGAARTRYAARDTMPANSNNGRHKKSKLATFSMDAG